MPTPTAQDMVDLYIAAEQELLSGGKSTTINGRTYTAENLAEIRKGRQEWESRARDEAAATAGRPSRNPALASFNS